MITAKNFVNIPNKTIWIIAFRLISDELSKVQFHPTPFDNPFTASKFTKNWNENVTEVLDIIEVQVPDLEAAMEDFDRNLEEVMEENKNLSKEDALIEATERNKNSSLGNYFVSTPYIDAYNRSESYKDSITFTQFKKLMKQQSEAWTNELDDRIDLNLVPNPLYENEKVTAFGNFNHDHYVYTNKLIKVEEKEINRAWDMT